MTGRAVAGLVQADGYPRGILAPYAREDHSLAWKIEQLRAEGEIVVICLPGHENDQDEFDCDRAVVFENGNWTLTKLG